MAPVARSLGVLTHEGKAIVPTNLESIDVPIATRSGRGLSFKQGCLGQFQILLNLGGAFQIKHRMVGLDWNKYAGSLSNAERYVQIQVKTGLLGAYCLL